MKNKPNICVVVPNKNGINHLSYSIASLQMTSYPNYHVVLVDDASKDNSLHFIRTHYPNIEIILNQGKKGFAGAVNTGIKVALEQGADYIAVFNSDIQVIPEWIQFVIDVFAEHPEVGLVGYTEVPKAREELFYNVRGFKLEYKDVKSLPGCLYICSSGVFKHVGLFDEKYFMYGEDNDFFSRLTRAGYIIVQTNVPVWHYGEASSENHRFSATWLAYRNALRFVIKNDSIIKIFRMILSLLNQGCNPFLDRKKDDPVFKRMRRYNISINFILILGSCCWNTINIISTLNSRYKAKRRIGI